MQGHDQTRVCAPRWVRLGLVLMAVSVPHLVCAQAPDGPEAMSHDAEPIDLAADRITAWGLGNTQWLVLQGQAAIIQGGVDGVRADQAVVRVVRSDEDGITASHVEIYAEGHVRPMGEGSAARPSARITLRTVRDVTLSPYSGDRGMVRLNGRPNGLAILDRAYPPPAAPKPAPTARPSGPRVASVAGQPVPASRPSASRPQVPASSVERKGTAPQASNVVPTQFRPAMLPEGVIATSSPSTAARPRSTAAPAGDAAPVPATASNAPGTGSGVAPVAASTTAPATAPVDPVVVPTQFGPEGFSDEPNAMPPASDLPPLIEAPQGDSPPPSATPGFDDSTALPEALPPLGNPPTDLEPLPGPDGGPASPTRPAGPGARVQDPGSLAMPITPGTQRVTRIWSRNGGPDFKVQELKTTDDHVQTFTLRGGVSILTESPAPNGVIDLSADSAIIWRRVDPNKPKGKSIGPDGVIVDDAGQPMEIYLEGNVVVRQDTREIAGNADQKTYRAKQVYYDFRTGRLIGLQAQLDMFAPGLIAPTKLSSPRIDQFRPLEVNPDGTYKFGLERIQANQTLMTGSRFPVPGYRFTSKSVDLTHVVSSKTNPTTGSTVGKPGSPTAEPNLTWNFDARQNVFYLGPLPVFYHPRISGDVDDIEPPLRQIRYGMNNYFGQQILSDFNGFRLFGIKRPQWIDSWTIDLDYLQKRTQEFPAIGTEIGWFGKDFLGDLRDPYRTRRVVNPNLSPDGYFGYLDVWGLKDAGVDVLGSGPAIVTSNTILPSGIIAGKRGYQRDDVPSFQDFRGRINMRHMQSLLTPDADLYEDFRFQVEAAYISDRQFLEEYYKRLSETGLDQETLAYVIKQKDNWAWSIWTEANLQNFNTETQWLPRLDYYRLGDSLLNNRLTYFQHSGIDYANTHTANEVNNPNIFAFMPYDPISNTSGVLSTGRAYSNHEIDMPMNFGNIVRFVPYLQGQVVGWNNQLGGNAIGRVWGAAGAKADIIAWKRYPDAESDLFNVHGLNHKMSFEADYRNAVSNVRLNQIGVQDDLDDNTYEFVRRYFALSQYIGGVLPQQYDPRHLILRRAISPISGTTDIQGTIQTLQLNFHSRLQTKRGPEGRRRVTDFMTLDVSTTFFPYATRDDFGQSFGQNMYNYQWFLGDRTSFISYGWFEFFKIGGQPTTLATANQPGYPFGLNVVTSGFSISRPPRGNVFIGYTVINSGPITTSALNPSVSYWLSPKWYGTFSTSYDFGNQILLASMFSFTRVGADYLTTFGLVVDPQRNNFSQIAIAISPRMSPNMRFGSGSGLTQFDSRFAPTQ